MISEQRGNAQEGEEVGNVGDGSEHDRRRLRRVQAETGSGDRARGAGNTIVSKWAPSCLAEQGGGLAWIRLASPFSIVFPAFAVSYKQRDRRLMRFVQESGDTADFDAVDHFFVADAHHVHRHLAGDQLGTAFLQIAQQC